VLVASAVAQGCSGSGATTCESDFDCPGTFGSCLFPLGGGCSAQGTCASGKEGDSVGCGGSGGHPTSVGCEGAVYCGCNGLVVIGYCGPASVPTHALGDGVSCEGDAGINGDASLVGDGGIILSEAGEAAPGDGMAEGGDASGQ
jgi:hypothetical protein